MAKEVERWCGGVLARPGEGRLLVLAGTNGTGKTHAAKAANRWIQDFARGKQWQSSPGVWKSIESAFWHWPRLLDLLKGGEWGIVDDMISVPALVIDELGGGHDPSMVGVDKLCQILSKREKKWTVITTNFPPSTWAQKFDERVNSRLFRNSTVVDLADVPDYSTL